MQALLNAIVTWLSINFGLPANYDLPKIKFAAPMEIAFIRYGAFSAVRRREVTTAYAALPAAQRQSVVSVYQDKEKSIVLPLGWKGVTPADISILVHEMVHHLQNSARLHYACPQEREALAYAAQEKWLGLFGRSLHSDFDIDEMTLVVSTRCLY